MKTLSRRDLLKTSLLAPAAVAAQGMGPMGAAIEAISQETRPQPVNSVPNPSASGTYRERLQLDFGWRFHLGNSNDPVKDFGFGTIVDELSPQFGSRGVGRALVRLN